MIGEPPDDDSDSERTIIRPAQRGRAALSAASLTVAATPTFDAPALASPLGAAATPLLQLLARLPTLTRPPDLTDLRERVVREIRGFERRAREQAIGMETVRPAHFVLCASIDDAVLNSPWAAAHDWRQRTLVASFHQDNGRDQDFDSCIARLRTDPTRFLPVLEILYLCLSLGFSGHRRPDPSRTQSLREELYALIADRRRALGSPAATPRSTGRRGAMPRVRVPVWLAAAIALALFGACYVGVTVSLGMASDQTRNRLLQAPPDQMPPIVHTS